MRIVHGAAYWGDNGDVLNLLFSYGADFINLKTKKGQSAYYITQMDQNYPNMRFIKSVTRSRSKTTSSKASVSSPLPSPVSPSPASVLDTTPTMSSTRFEDI